MRKFIANLTAVASLALAAIPLIGLTQAAQAGEPSARIAVGDLDLRDPAQAVAFQARIDSEGRKLCRQITTGEYLAGLRLPECMTRVRAEVGRQLSPAQRGALSVASRAAPVEVAAR